MRYFIGLVCVLALGVMGCGETTGTGGTGPIDCGGSDRCVVDPGGEWMGPFALTDSATGCRGEFPAEAAQPLFNGLEAGGASCDCDCTPTAMCSSQLSTIAYSTADCTGPPRAEDSFIEFQCFVAADADSRSVGLGSATTMCGQSEVRPSIPAPTWSRSVSVCGGFTAGTGQCDAGETCVPTPGAEFESGYCYLRDGNHACPPEFPNKTLYYTSLSDTRACPDTCTCQGSGASCSVDFTGYATSICTDPVVIRTVLSGGEACLETVNPDTLASGMITVVDDGTCASTPVSPSGTVTEEGATTVCCD